MLWRGTAGERREREPRLNQVHRGRALSGRLPRALRAGTGEDQGCEACHSREGTGLSVSLPVDQWRLDAHAGSAVNPRFLSMYGGTDLSGNQSPPTRFTQSRDYGRIPLLPDPDEPYFGPGYALDFPETAGNCAACHVPAAAVDDPYGVDPIVSWFTIRINQTDVYRAVQDG